MKKLHSNLTWQEIYDSVRKKESIIFIATRIEIEFQNIENEIHKDYQFAFPLDTFTIQPISEILSLDAIGKVQISPITKIRLHVKLKGGEILYKRINSGAEWEVSISF